MKKPFFWGIILLGLAFIVQAKTVSAAVNPRLYLDPATDSVESGSQFTVKLFIDAGTKLTVAADAKISFPKAKLEVVTVKAGTYFDSVSKIIGNKTGSLEIHAYNKISGETKTGLGELATITFKSLSPGSAIIDLVCNDSSTTDSNIADVSGNDIIDCTQTSGSEILIDQVGAGVAGAATPTPTPAELPQAGNINPSILLLAFGSLALILGFASLAIQKEFV
jgi:hypothetical protein